MQLSALSMRLCWLHRGSRRRVFSSTSALQLLPWLWATGSPAEEAG